ncbi:hypothetical protein BSL78_19764 [Apostichopus japonicus]|uniref:Uncharacterized protein n=1 Tax=Stichopus japonicus TaxID=307972 RepID=A0A2G8K5Y2_STIJA|nr:hypothetical protein BSL78_19764 [Apostichopus japonicus]
MGPLDGGSAPGARSGRLWCRPFSSVPGELYLRAQVCRDWQFWWSSGPEVWRFGGLWTSGLQLRRPFFRTCGPFGSGALPLPLLLLLPFDLALELVLFPDPTGTATSGEPSPEATGSKTLPSGASGSEAGAGGGESLVSLDCNFSLRVAIQASISCQFAGVSVTHIEHGSRREQDLHIGHSSWSSQVLPGRKSEQVAHLIDVLPSFDAI